MKIKFTKKRLRAHLILGLLWLALCLVRAYFGTYDDWTDWFFVGMAALYLGQFFLEWRNQYLTIDEEQIKVNYPFGKKIKLSEINRIKKFAGDYTLETDDKKLTINTQIIAPASVEELNGILAKLNLPGDKTPF